MKGIGFDLNGSVMSSVVVNAGLKQVRIEDVASVVATSEEEARIERLREIRRSAAYAAISVPVHAVSSRMVSLPFAQQSRWNAILPAELEGQIPFELEDVVIDGALAKQSGTQSMVLAIALPKATLRSHLDQVGKAGVDPRVVTVDAEALVAAAGAWLPSGNEVALLHVDDRAVTMALTDGGRLRAMRAVLWKGEAFRDVPSLSGEISDGSAALLLSLKPALEDIARTLRADRVETSHRVSAVAVSGRWSDVPGFAEGIAGALSLERVSWPMVEVSGTSRPLGPVVIAAGLAVLAVRGAGRINFRQGEFVYGRERAGIRRRLIAVAVLSAFVFVAGAVDFGLRWGAKQDRLADVNDRVREAFHSALPGVTIVSEPDQLQTAIAALVEQREFLGGKVGALDVLLALTDAIPSESGIAVSDLSMEADKVRIEAETLSFDWVNKIEGALSRASFVKSVAVSDAKTTVDQSRVRFVVTLTLAEGV